jgi:hypothetical protein
MTDMAQKLKIDKRKKECKTVLKGIELENLWLHKMTLSD